MGISDAGISHPSEPNQTRRLTYQFGQALSK